MSSRSKYQDVTKSRHGNRRMMESIKKQARDIDLWRAAAAEFLATFIFIFIVCVSNMMPNSTYDISATETPTTRISLQTSVGIALTYATLIQSFEHISGGHMNPAISLAMVIAGHVSVFKAVVYVISQLAGAFSAVALCFGMLPFNTRANSVSQLNVGIQPLQGFGIEILQTIVVTVTWLATLATSRSQLGSSALPVGMAFLANSLWAGQLTGSCMNPARSLSTALLSHYNKDLWVYVAGPFLGSIVGAILYTQVFVSTPKRPGSSTITESGRSAEGQSVQSDQDATEMMPLTRLTATPRHNVPTAIQNSVYTAIQMTPQHPEAIVGPVQPVLQREISQQPATIPQQQVYFTSSRPQHNLQQHVNVARHQSTPLLYHPVTPQQPQTSSQATTQLLQNLSRPVNSQHQTLPSAVRRINANGQRYPVTQVTSQGVVVTRSASRPASRPNTACGTQITPSSRTNSVNNYENATRNSRSNAATPAAGFRSISASETYSESSDNLLNSSVL